MPKVARVPCDMSDTLVDSGIDPETNLPQSCRSVACIFSIPSLLRQEAAMSPRRPLVPASFRPAAAGS